jgi:Bifunctional DNA primase/polymerase, N-terminal
MNLLQSAKSYANKGLSVISTDNSKTSIFSWKKYQTNIATDQELEQMFNTPKAKGIAVICGAVSGNLEVIDVDCKYGINWAEYEYKILQAHPELYGRLKIIQTKSNGYHIYYRCESIEGNQKLAERPATDDEKFINPNAKQFVLIETRGEAGYVIAPPSDGYTPLDKNDIPIITLEERDLLLSIARSFNQIVEQIKQPVMPTTGSNLTIWDDYNQRGDLIALMEKHGWRVVREDNEKFYLLRPGQTSSVTSAVVFKDKRIFYPHTTSTSFQNKGYNPFAVYTHLECKGDWKKACKQLSDVYGDVNTDGWFWNKTEKGHVIISRFKFQEWLHDNYVQLYFHNKNSGAYRLVHTDNKRIKEVHAEDIKKYVKQELVKHNHIDVMEAVMKSTNSYFVPSFFEYIDKADVKIMHDKQDKCYFPFNNQIVVITKDNISSINYGDIDEYIWESQIIDKDIKINTEFDPLTSVFFKFLCKISGDDTKRVQYAMTLIGYILHSFKDPSKPYAPILAEETDDESKGGGTGKGLFFQAIAKLIPVVIIDGKTFKPDKTFAYQRVTLGTKLVIIEDCPKNVDFEKFYPTITEGITIEKKNQDELHLNFSESPKIAFTTNYTISNNSEHSRRRQKVLEFAPFFNSKNTPLDVFGHTFFTDWDHDEWTKFYNLMFYCVKEYMEIGIVQVDNSAKLKRKQIKQQFGEDFLDYYDDLESGNFKSITDEWKGFLMKYELDKKEYSLKRFKKGLVIASEVFENEFLEEKNWQHNNIKMFKINKKSNNIDKSLTDNEYLY